LPRRIDPAPAGYVTLLGSPLTRPSGRALGNAHPELLFNTVSLAGAVAVLTLILGVSTAWLVVRFDFPAGGSGKRR